MTTREVLESRLYVAEDAMYRRGDELDHQLHELEAKLKGLTAAVHHELCETGRVPIAEKADDIVRAVEAFEAGVDLAQLRWLTDRVTSLRGSIETYEQQIEATRTTSDHPAGAKVDVATP